MNTQFSSSVSLYKRTHNRRPFTAHSGRVNLQSRSLTGRTNAHQPRANAENGIGIQRREVLLGAGFLSVVNVTLPLIPSRALAAEKKENMPIDELKDLIVKDFQENQYYITGKLTPEVFEDDCVFTDPTTR